MAGLLKRAMDNAPAAAQLERQRLLAEVQAQLNATQAENGELHSALAISRQRETEQTAKLAEAENRIALLKNELARYAPITSTSSSAAFVPTQLTSSFSSRLKRHIGNPISAVWRDYAWEICGAGSVAYCSVAYAIGNTRLAMVPLALTVPGCVSIFQAFGKQSIWRLAAGISGLIGGLTGAAATASFDAAEIRDFMPYFFMKGEPGDDTFILPYKLEAWSQAKRFKVEYITVPVPALKSNEPAQNLTCIRYWQGALTVANRNLPGFNRQAVPLDPEPYKESGDCKLIKAWRASISPVHGG